MQEWIFRKMQKEYKLSIYQDYGPLEEKEHIHLVRNKNNGKLCIKKFFDREQKDIVEFRKKNTSWYFPQVFDVIESEDQYIIIEEYIEGMNLENYMMGESLPENIAVQFIRHICRALLCLHSAEPMIIYRDLKPENIMITPQGHVKLIDFNISRRFQEGKNRDTRLLGTAEYAAPEQFGYFQTDHRTDIYALGVLFNYMLTGKFPVEYVTEGKYAGMIRKCIELEPEKRYQSVVEILMILGSEDSDIKSPGMKLKAQDNEKEVSWKPPGFRSGKVWKMIIAVLGYAMILYMGLTIEFTDGNGIILPLTELWVNRILFTLSQIVTVLFNCNYGGVLNKIPFLRKSPLIIRCILWVVSWFVFICIFVIITLMLESIIHL